MSELKAGYIDDLYCEFYESGMPMAYLKDEVDKVIAHNKCKRCLAMAMVLEHICPITIRKAKWKGKWHLRWLTLADKYKEGNV